MDAFSRFFPNKNEVFGGEQVTIKLSRNMGFPTCRNLKLMCDQQRLIPSCAYVQSDRSLLVARIFHDPKATDRILFGVSKLKRRLV